MKELIEVAWRVTIYLVVWASIISHTVSSHLSNATSKRNQKKCMKITFSFAFCDHLIAFCDHGWKNAIQSCYHMCLVLLCRTVSKNWLNCSANVISVCIIFLVCSGSTWFDPSLHSLWHQQIRRTFCWSNINSVFCFYVPQFLSVLSVTIYIGVQPTVLESFVRLVYKLPIRSGGIVQMMKCPFEPQLRFCSLWLSLGGLFRV